MTRMMWVKWNNARASYPIVICMYLTYDVESVEFDPTLLRSRRQKKDIRSERELLSPVVHVSVLRVRW